MPVTCEHQELIGLRGESGVALNREREREREREKDSFEGFAAPIAACCEAIWQTHTHTHTHKHFCAAIANIIQTVSLVFIARQRSPPKKIYIYSEKSIWSLRIDQHLTCKLYRLSRGGAEM